MKALAFESDNFARILLLVTSMDYSSVQEEEIVLRILLH